MYSVFFIISQHYLQRKNICSPVGGKGKTNKQTNHKQLPIAQKKPKPLKTTKICHCHNMLTFMLTDCKESTQTLMANRLGSQSPGCQ